MLERIKKDPVLFISGILAIVSCFFVHPDKEYIGYVDFRVLSILFCMMIVVIRRSWSGMKWIFCAGQVFGMYGS